MERRFTPRVPGHRLSLEWSGERGEESSTTGTCACGDWQESGSSQKVVRDEYRHHLIQKDREQRALEAKLRAL